MITPAQARELRTKINILESIRTHGGNSKSRILRHSELGGASHGYIMIDEMITDGYLHLKQLQGARTWITLTPKGKQTLEKWEELRGLLYGCES